MYALYGLYFKSKVTYMYFSYMILQHTDYPCFLSGSVVKNLSANTGDVSSVPKSGRSPGEGNGNSLQYPCLKNPMDREAWWATVH